MAFPLQQLEGKYEILEKIAEGGMGAVYKVRHRLLEEIRVIKVMRPQLEQQEENKSRFLREAKIAVRMRHPNIAQMYDFSIDDSGNSFIVMEYIDGVTLQDLLKRSGPPGVALCLEIAQQSLQALGYLHRKGIVHRDISPDNLMLSQDEVGEPAVKLIDLGIAKPSHGESNLTATGLFLGKIKYASPEHFKASEGIPVDQRSDLYSFGLVLYEVLTGVHPVAGSNWSELIAGHLFEKPRDFATTDPDGRLPEELRQVVLTSLAKVADERFPDAKTFRRSILHLQTSFPLAQEEFDRFLKLRERDRAAKAGARAGTTQERLDAQFGAGSSTPAPTSTPAEGLATAHREAAPTSDQTRQVTPSAPAARTQERVRELLEGARRLADLNLHEEAILQARAAQQLDPTNQDVAALLEAIDAGQRRAQLIESRIEAIERLIAEESFRDALEHVIEAVAELGAAEEFQELRARIEQLEAQYRFSRAAALVKEAHSLADAQAFTDAIARLEQAEDLDPGNTVVRSHLAEVREAMRTHEKARHQATVVSESADAVEALIVARDLDQARRRLDEAIDRCGQDPILVGLGERIAAIEEEHRADQVTKLLAEAAAATSTGDHRESVNLLEQASGIDPESSEVAQRLQEARNTLRAAEEQSRLAAEMGEAKSEVESLLASDRLADARSRLDQALDRLGLQTPLVALGDRILELEAQQRTRAVSALLDEASSRADTGDHAAAVATLERALELDPDNTTVSSRLEAARAAQAEGGRRRREEETRQVPTTSPADVLSMPASDRTMAIPTTSATAAVSPDAVEDRTTALPVARAAEPAPPADRTVAIPTEVPKAPEAPKPAPKFRPKRATPAPPPQPIAVGSRAVPAVVPKVEKPAPPAAEGRSRAVPWLVIGGAAALLAIVVGVIAVVKDKGPPAGVDTGMVVINAVPWAEIESIVNAQDTPQEIGSSSFTPLAVALPPGRYRISLRNPTNSEPLVVEAEVKVGETSRAPLADFGAIEVSTVLEKYGL